MLATAPRYYAEQQHLTALAVQQLRRSDDVTSVLRQLAVYQATAALLAVETGTAALEEQQIPAGGATVLTTAFTVATGAPSVLSDVQTDLQFSRIVATLVADAGRSAMGVYTATRTEEIGHVRILTPPSCPRCAILAGRWYRWSDGFQRHPNCDCQMLPGTRDVGVYDVNSAYRNGQIHGLTKAQRDAIDAGADINQVVNATRGMQTIDFAGRRVQVTSEGTSVRGLAYRALSQRGGSTNTRAPRLTPEAIYRVADGDRDVAARLLRINGYIL